MQGTRPVSTPGITHQRRPAQTETLAGTDHGSRLPLTRIVPTFLFRPPSARQRRREKSGTGPSNPRPREESLPGAHRARAPRSGSQDPPKETAVRVVRAGTGRSSVRPGYRVLRLRHDSDHHRELRGQARARQTRLSQFSRTQSLAGLGWESHVSRPEKW